MNFDQTIHRIISIALTACGFMVATVGPIVVMLSKDPNITGNATLMKILAGVGTVVTACGVIANSLKYWADQHNATQLKLAYLATTSPLEEKP